MRLRLGNEDIRVAVGLRLGTATCETHAPVSLRCSIGNGLHGFSCMSNSGTNATHSNINDFILSCFKTDRDTCNVTGSWDTPYLHRLNILNLESLEERRLHNEMICVFKLFHGLFNLNVKEFFTLSHNSTRGHALKKFKPCCTHSYAQHFFTNRVINLWNSLPD